MRNDVVLEKTQAGQQEIRSSRHSISSRARQMLIAINGELTVFELRQRFPRGDADEALGEILRAGLAAPTAETLFGEDGGAPFDVEQLAQALMARAAGATGLSGYLFQRRLKSSATRAQLKELLPEFQRIVADRHGEIYAADQASRVGMLLKP